MKPKNLLGMLIALGMGLAMGALAVAVPFMAQAQAPGPIDTTITFQGRLQLAGSQYITDTCGFEFSLYDTPTPSTGSTVGFPNPNSRTNVNVTDGYFTVDLDFGDVFDGSQRFLEVAVNCATITGGYETLNERMPLNALPYALYAKNAVDVGKVSWGNIINLPAGFADNTDHTGQLSGFICGEGQILVRTAVVTGSSTDLWACAPDVGSQPGSVDHGNLNGLTDDDHPQYLLVDGNRTMTGQLRMGGKKIVTLTAGSNISDAVTYQQAVKGNNPQDPAGGDLAGTYPNPVVDGLQNRTVATTTPVISDSLVWSGSQWTPAPASIAGPAGGDLSGTYPNPTVARIQGYTVSTTAPSNVDDVLMWNGTEWEPTAFPWYPSGAVIFLNATTCPSGWSELTNARGRYLVGLNSGGSLGSTVGTALTNQENRAVGQHNHSISDPGHRHTVNLENADGGSGAYADNSALGPVIDPEFMYTSSDSTGISVNNAGTTAGTNAPYLQLLACRRN